MIKRRVYVASSWRNELQPEVVKAVRAAGHEVYDFRHPMPDEIGFAWSDIDPEWQQWTPGQFREALAHPIACHGFSRDRLAMQWADACILVMPCGRSAHIEAGYFVGAGKLLIILLSSGEPELMYKLADCVALSVDEAVRRLGYFSGNVPKTTPAACSRERAAHADCGGHSCGACGAAGRESGAGVDGRERA